MSIIPESPAQRRARMLDERQRGGTFFEHGQAAATDEAGGRFGARGAPTVVGAEPIPKYPQLPEGSPWSGLQPGPGDEPPLGFDNPALASPVGVQSMLPPTATGGAPSSVPAPGDDVVAPPSSSPNGDGPVTFVEGMTSSTVLHSGSSPSNKRRR